MIDGLLLIGRNPGTGLELSSQEAVRQLDRRGADAAIVAAYDAIFYDRDAGDLQTIRLAKQNPGRLIPAAAWVGPRQNAAEDPERFRQLHRQGVRVLAALKSPSYYVPLFRSTGLRRALELAHRLGWVFLAGLDNAQDLADLEEVTRGLEIPVLVRWARGRAYQAAGEITAVLKERPNFFFDVSAITQTSLLKKWTEQFGASRFFYASGAPEEIEGAGRAALEAADLPSETKELIAHGNLARLLGLKLKAQRRPVPAVPAAMARLPKIDTHWHTGGWNLDEPGRDVKMWRDVHRKWNIQKSIFSSIRALNGDLERGNEENFDAVREIPGAYGLVVVDPTRADLSIRQIRRYAHGSAGTAVGVKTIQDLYNMKLDDAAYAPIWKEALRLGLTVMAHKPGMAAAARAFPKLRWVCAHMTLGRAEELLKAKNVWLDLATSHADAHETRLTELMRTAGSGRLLFASDAPLMDPAWTLGKIACAGLGPAVLTQIFYKNALAAFPKLKRTTS